MAFFDVLAGGDTLQKVLMAQLGLGLLASAWVAEPSVALALFGILGVIQGHQEMLKLFIVFNGLSIIIDVLRLMLSDVPAYAMLLLVLIMSMLCKAYATYLCYDMYGLGGSSSGSGDHSEYQPAAAGPGGRHDPFYEPPPANPNLYSQPPARNPAEAADGQQL